MILSVFSFFQLNSVVKKLLLSNYCIVFTGKGAQPTLKLWGFSSQLSIYPQSPIYLVMAYQK